MYFIYFKILAIIFNQKQTKKIQSKKKKKKTFSYLLLFKIIFISLFIIKYSFVVIAPDSGRNLPEILKRTKSSLAVGGVGVVCGVGVRW